MDLYTVSPGCGPFKALGPGAPELRQSWGVVMVVLCAGNDCHNCGPIGITMVVLRLRDRFPIQFCSLFFLRGRNWRADSGREAGWGRTRGAWFSHLIPGGGAGASQAANQGQAGGSALKKFGGKSLEKFL